MTDAAADIDRVLMKFMREIESSVHAFYRGDVRQNTQRIKTDTFLRDARQALLAMMPESAATGSPATASAPGSAPTGAAPSRPALAPDELAVAMRCIMAWMPLGAPTTASPESRCVPAAREMLPTWGERERARQALARAAG